MKPETLEVLKRIFGEEAPRANVSKTKKVINCEPCKGVGFTEDEELSCYHKREYTTIYNACSKCKGDGRLVETTIKITVPTKWPIYNSMTFEEKSTAPYSEDPIEKTHETAWNDYFRFSYDGN